MKLTLFRNAIIFVSLILLAGGIGFRLGASRQGYAFVSGTFAGTSVPPSTAGVNAKGIDFSLFWDVWQRLSDRYIDKKALDTQKMFYGAISGMVASLNDPYTLFLPPKENKEAKDDLGGLFEGIGAQLGMKDKRIIIMAPLPGTPAEQAGLRAGDWILKVDGEDTLTWTLPQAVSHIRGTKGTAVTLSILHEKDNKPKDIRIVRDQIHVASVEWKKENLRCTSGNGSSNCTLVKGSCSDCISVAVLKLTRFGDTTISEWDKAVGEIAKENCGLGNPRCSGIVLDVRNNPGGYLQGAIYIGSEFLADGTITKQKNSDGSVQTYAVERKGKLVTQPLVVLANKGSASASEIVAGALKVRGRARMVGEKTYGKGSVQDAEDLANGAGLHVTIALWLLPDDSQINGSGIEPNVAIEPLENTGGDTQTRDIQLEKAVEDLVYNSSNKKI